VEGTPNAQRYPQSSLLRALQREFFRNSLLDATGSFPPPTALHFLQAVHGTGICGDVDGWSCRCFFGLLSQTFSGFYNASPSRDSEWLSHMVLRLSESNNASFAQLGVDIDSLGMPRSLSFRAKTNDTNTLSFDPPDDVVSPSVPGLCVTRRRYDFFCGTIVCMQHCVPPTVTIMRSLS
jgi:hypothetical protein